VLDEAVEYDDELFPAGSYDANINEIGSPERVAAGLGGYWTDFDRSHPIEGPARSQAWTGTVHGLFGELGVGVVTASTLQLGLGVSALVFGLGLTIMLLGIGLVWTGKGKEGATYAVIADTASTPETASV
jgi:hypothetical protein